MCSFFPSGDKAIVTSELNIGSTYCYTTPKALMALTTPEINISKDTNSSDIPSGSAADDSFNTVFGQIEIGDFTEIIYYIENEGTANLDINGVSVTGANAGDFTVSEIPSTVNVGSTLTNSISFSVTFTPSSSGIRTATISIENNDSDENPYTFNVKGEGICSSNFSSLSPSSASIGGSITISSSLDLSISNTVTLDGVSLPYNIVSSSQITITIPSGANSGDLVVTNHQGCSTTNAFTVIKNVFTGCQGGAVSTPTELFISEVTDANSGELTYIELYNGTGSSVDLGTYSLEFFDNGSSTNNGDVVTLPSFSLADGEIYVVAVGSSATVCTGIFGADASLADYSTSMGGVDFTTGENDHIKLFNGAVEVDQWGVYESNTWADGLGLGTSGANFRRLNTATIPNLTYNNSDWTVINWTDCSNDDYSDIGVYNLTEGTSPVVIVQPVYSPDCGTVTLNTLGVESFPGGSGLTYQWYSNPPGSSTWFTLTNSGVYSGTNTATLFISSTSSLNNYQYYCRVREGGATCYSATNTVTIYDEVSTWNGFFWNNGPPNFSRKAVINGNYNTSINGSFECCSMLVNATRILTISSGTYINIDDNLVNNGTINIEDSASIIQSNETNSNSGASGVYTIERVANATKFDYVYWSSPVDNFSIGNIPNSHRYSWSTTGINPNGSQGSWVTASGSMSPGKGYIVRASNGQDTSVTTNFSGNINNGLISVNVTKGTDSNSINDNYNLIGNPYPSAIDVEAFLFENADPTGPNPVIEGAVRIWTHGTPLSSAFPNPFYQNFQYNYNSNDYIIYNGTGTSSGPEGFNGKIASGQGFFVIMQEAASSSVVNFKNSMRSKLYDNSQFYKNTLVSNASSTTLTKEKNRIWLHLIDNIGNSSRTLVGYITGATLAKDAIYDAAIEPSSMYLYSLIGDKKQAIQGRPVPFDSSDEVPLGIKILTPGDYTITIAGVDGLFKDVSQNIYLEDTQLNVIHDLRQSPYVFTTQVGEFNDRFVLRYTNAILSNSSFERDTDFIISAKDKIFIKAAENIEAVAVYDLLGRNIFSMNAIHSPTVILDKLNPTKEAIIIKTKLENGAFINRKIIY